MRKVWEILWYIILGPVMEIETIEEMMSIDQYSNFH